VVVLVTVAEVVVIVTVVCVALVTVSVVTVVVVDMVVDVRVLLVKTGSDKQAPETVHPVSPPSALRPAMDDFSWHPP